MSKLSNNQGRAYEYICLKRLQSEISKQRPAKIIENSCLEAAQRAWDDISVNLRNTLTISAEAAVRKILELEGLILEKDEGAVELLIQKDSAGEEGDVRDILIIRKNIDWEIGLSIKHNHFAVKHSRLAKTLDFGERWYGVPCSKDYWNEVSPIFDYLRDERTKGTAWSDLPDKALMVYVPLLKAFIDEVLRAYNIDKEVPRRMVEYLIGEHDFYKIISLDNKKLTQIQVVNAHGELGKPSRTEKSSAVIPISKLPTKIVNMELREGCTNYADLYLNNGWQFSFRIHNASTIVEPSLKFDIQFIGLPATIITINCPWF